MGRGDLKKLCSVKLGTFLLSTRTKISSFVNASLLAKVATAGQSAKIVGPLPILDGMPGKGVPHSSLNFVKGVVYSGELLRYSVEKLTE